MPKKNEEERCMLCQCREAHVPSRIRIGLTKNRTEPSRVRNGRVLREERDAKVLCLPPTACAHKSFDAKELALGAECPRGKLRCVLRYLAECFARI